MERTDALRSLPQVDELLRRAPGLDAVGPTVARWLVRRAIDEARERILAGGEAGDLPASVAAAAADLHTRRVRRVVNATGVVLHTNLGRAPLAAAARDAILEAMDAAAVEYDVGTGDRAERAPVASTLAAALCDADDALVVNNNAGALLLMLAALAKDREVIVARGEMIEIGGSFRLPDVMTASGALLREVGTTNRTHERDYRDAVTDRTGAILKVHPSNFRVVGFTSEPALADLAALARETSVPLLFDIGSGLLDPHDGVLEHEPDARTAIASGADLICFSGDKLLGGPQAGIIAGRADLVQRCRRHPIARAVRADKLTLAALEATLWLHARAERDRIPTLAMLDASAAEIERRAKVIADATGATVVAGASMTGGGSVPGEAIPTWLVRVVTDHPHRIASRLRSNDPPIIARIEGGAVVLDPRTIPPADDELVADAVRVALVG